MIIVEIAKYFLLGCLSAALLFVVYNFIRMVLGVRRKRKEPKFKTTPEWIQSIKDEEIKDYLKSIWVKTLSPIDKTLDFEYEHLYKCILDIFRRYEENHSEEEWINKGRDIYYKAINNEIKLI